MLIGNIVSTIGLALEMVGVVMLARYGLAAWITPEGHVLRHHGDDMGWKPLPEAKAYADRCLRWLRVGWTLIVCGLVGQAAGLWIPSLWP
ncbi:MAG TPA: hypothetical protein VI485_30090 [Vicinamibacterales bacterium]|nr:hypothetical protein [Vicinamibacterales bacterium]